MKYPITTETENLLATGNNYTERRSNANWFDAIDDDGRTTDGLLEQPSKVRKDSSEGNEETVSDITCICGHSEEDHWNTDGSCFRCSCSYFYKT
jgi:hypothetical protein